MGYAYTQEEWLKRYAERVDLSAYVTHLTKPAGEAKSIDVLFKILREKKLVGSTTASGFVVGDRPAVCFQDAPPYAVAQNVYFETKLRKQHGWDKIRYTGFGLMLPKPFVYGRGGRPVLYEEKETATKFLPPEEHWRVVSLDLSDQARFVDWTHEREWRLPGDLEFDPSLAHIIVPTTSAYREFVTRGASEGNVHQVVGGVINLSTIFL